ncbi:MAG: DUF2892 domain-containing protein [Thermoleophilia bacterium]|nr:DUF2892 domain-containing protein [Gaiellaceae bacterium]MDW8338138.1 DUF2892 domain-containing protein [Thermoleophilia bacterium]
MTRNMGTWDRLVRGLVVAPLAAIGAVAVGIGSALGIVLLVVAGIMVATALVGSCPLYRLVGLSTCPVSRTRSA